MATPSITYQIDHHVSIELITKINGQLRHENHRFRIIAVDVEYGRLNHFRDVGTVLGGPHILRRTGGKPDLIVENNVEGPASTISSGLRHLKRLHDHALPRKGGIAVQHDGDHCFTDSIFAPILTCAHRVLY